MRALRSARFRGPMARLALCAILLLALVPTLGRLAQARASGSDATPAWTALCTVRGLERVPPLAGMHGASQDALQPASGAPASPHGAGGADCDYCPLLAMAVPVAIAPVAVPHAALPPALCTSPSLPSREQPHPCGLGSRGPPSAS